MKHRSRPSFGPILIALAIVATSFMFPAALAAPDVVTECTGQPDDTACTDGNTCTVGDVCRSGYCLAPVSYRRAADVSLTTSTGPLSIAYGDFNGDGHLDLATGNGSNPGKVTILLGSGTGAFNPPFVGAQPITVGGYPNAIAVVDLDRDGKLDLAVSTGSTVGSVTILRGDGLGGFAVWSVVSVGGTPQGVVVGDFDGDGNLDLAVVNQYSNSVTILRGDGSGNFPARADFSVGSNPVSLGVGDWNGDGKLDLAVANYNANNITILLGNGTGGFSQAGSPIGTGTRPHALRVGDWNGDGKLDLVVANTSSNNVTILLGDGAGGFVQPPGSPVAVGTSPTSIAVGDLNGDGKLDLATGGSLATSTILFGNGSGGFGKAAGSLIPWSQYPKLIVCADWNEDGRLDLAIATSGSVIPVVQVILSNTTPVSLTASTVGARTNPDSVAVGDWDGDGKLDLAIANHATNNVTIQLGDGAGGFSEASGSPKAAGTSPTALVTGDFNRDGKLDLALANFTNPGTVTVLLGNGAGGFSPAGSPIAVGLWPDAVAVGDFDQDGKLDLAVANSGLSSNVTILLGNGAGGFSQALGSPISVGRYPSSIAVGDLNGDGRLDLAVANHVSDSVTILLGNGSGGFSQAAGSPIAVPGSVYSVAAGDWNADGKLDLAVTNSGSAHNDITILMGNGAGGFSEAPGSPVPVSNNNVTSIAVGDLNGDGRLDLAVTNSSGSTGGVKEVQVLVGNGLGGFSLAADTPAVVGTNPQAIAIGNFDGIGFPDLAVADYSSNDVTILLNETTYSPDGTACNDGNACTQTDVCHSGACTGTNPRVCLPSDNCHAAACNKTTGLCMDSPAPKPPEVGDGVRLWKGVAATVIGWNPAAGSSSSSILTGLVNRLPVNAGAGAEFCLESDLPFKTWTTATDSSSPAPGTGRWYLVRGVNACAPGTFGYSSAGVERTSTVACP